MTQQVTEQASEQVTEQAANPWADLKARQDQLFTRLSESTSSQDTATISDELQSLADEAKALINAPTKPTVTIQQPSPYSEPPNTEHPKPNTEHLPATDAQPNTPQIGDHVLYRLDRGPNTGDIRPAIIVRIWSGGAGVNMLVFTDCINDDIEKIFWAVNRVEGDKPGSWSRYPTTQPETSAEPETRNQKPETPPPVGAALVDAQEPTPTNTAETPPRAPTAAQQPEPAKPPENTSNPRATQPQPCDPDHRSSP